MLNIFGFLFYFKIMFKYLLFLFIPSQTILFWFIGQYINSTLPARPDYIESYFFGWSPTLRARIKMYCQWPVFKQQSYPTVRRLSVCTVDDR